MASITLWKNMYLKTHWHVEREREDEYEEEKVTGEDKEEICTEEMGGGFSQNTFYSHI